MDAEFRLRTNDSDSVDLITLFWKIQLMLVSYFGEKKLT